MSWVGDFIDAHTVEVMAAMTAVGGAVSQLARWAWTQWVEHRRESEVTKAEAALAIQKELQRIPDETASLRALLIRLERVDTGNSDAEKGLYLTIVQEARAAGVEPISSFWQRRRVEAYYIQGVLRPLLDGEDQAHIDREFLDHGTVRDQWIISGVHSSSLFAVHRTPDNSEIWYVSFHHAVPKAMYLELFTNEDDETSVTTTRTRHTMAMVASRVSSLVQEIC